MRLKTSWIAFFAVFLAAGSTVHASCEHDETTFRCVRYLKNYDADSITFQIDGVHPLIGKSISVRVLGLDTPEIKGKTVCEKRRAVEARDFVAGIMRRAKRVDLTDVGRDKYFRILADVRVDGKSLTETLLREGYAYRYDGGTKAHPDWCKPLRLPAGRSR